jgi:hypothetical protein
MKHKFKIIIITLLSTIINIRCQDMKKTKSMDLSKATIKIDSCGLYYKGERLDLGQNHKEWEKILGKPSRIFNGVSIWDDKGISIDYFQNEENMVAELYIHFLNLDSKEGLAGELNHARGWAKFDEKNWDVAYLKENGKRLKEENNPKNFIYPFTLYKGHVNLHGFPVGAGMKVDEINSYRKDLSFSGPFRYVDDDIDGVNDSGNTTDTFGGDYRAGGTECKDNRLQYYEVTYTASGSLEYLKIGYENLTDFKNRKERDERHKKEQEKN